MIPDRTVRTGRDNSPKGRKGPRIPRKRWSNYLRKQVESLRWKKKKTPVAEIAEQSNDICVKVHILSPSVSPFKSDSYRRQAETYLTDH
jgi:hypothetical protein